MIDYCLRSVKTDEGGINVITIKIIDRLGLVCQYSILVIVSKSHDRYLAYVRLSKVTQRMIIELATPRVEFVVVFYASVLRDTFLDTFYPLKNTQSILNGGSINCSHTCSHCSHTCINCSNTRIHAKHGRKASDNKQHQRMREKRERVENNDIKGMRKDET